jgi:transcription initiation factor TFIID subunit 6
VIEGHRIYSDVAADHQLLVGEHVSRELCGYFANMMDLYETGTEESMACLSTAISNDAGIQPLLPFFLQFMAGQLTVGCNDTFVVRKVALLGVALVENLSLAVHFFVHALIRTAMTVLLRYETGMSVEEDIEVRHMGGNFLYQTCVRCASGFPMIMVLAQDALIRSWLNPCATHPSQLGAFIGLCTFGPTAIVKILPHLKGYLGSLQRELRFANPTKRTLMAKVVVNLGQLLEEQLHKMGEQAEYQGILNDMAALEKQLEDSLQSVFPAKEKEK